MPGVSNTCAATGPVAELRLLIPGRLPVLQVPKPGPADSPKAHRYSRSWKGRVVAVAAVPVASKDTANGATPVKRLGTVAKEASVMAVAVPVVVVVQPGSTPPPVRMTPTVGPGGNGVPAGGRGGGTKVVVMVKLEGVGAMTVVGPLRLGIDDPVMTMGAPLVNVLLATRIT